MNKAQIAQARLRNQLLAMPAASPAEVVRRLGAVQAQDYYSAQWALGLRLQSATEQTVETAFAKGEILRTHVMRPTWHFVTPADIRWLLQLTAARVNAKAAYQYRKLELDGAVFKRSNKALAKALRGGRQLTREVLRAAVAKAGIACDDLLRFTHILFRAELDGVICSGARQGKHFTYALLEERVPPAKPLARDEALAELTHRYFQSHGPATLPDFVWWSGLSASDAKSGIEMNSHRLNKQVVEKTSLWFASVASADVAALPVTANAYLLPAFDEYLVSYKDRSAAFTSRSSGREMIELGWVIVISGRVVGNWKRSVEKDAVNITLSPFAPLTRAHRHLAAEAAQRYGEFLRKNVKITFSLREE
jgi:hypothetical protein